MTNDQATVDTPKQLLHKLKSLVVEAETMMVDTLSEHSTEAIAKLRARFDATHERFNALCQIGRKNVVAGARYPDATIRDHSYQSLAIAAGVGLLVGLLAGRRSS